ncbi:hypothetical protein LTR56_004691 [Elasticomyces elasticus]|nr:hypothetical protein LTR56_004691 [Elasticomyces elasticus]KAK3665545.1 hypothetical protein LTR22_003485 [Elasticomyces elasticus]KAK4930417.1 hypothetical protein LTR49_003158 [Elasticomyces elasticus]KAK5768857.1 hypothetical protein LTS12_000917 [Elasticomyces elasticus]
MTTTTSTITTATAVTAVKTKRHTNPMLQRKSTTPLQPPRSNSHERRMSKNGPSDEPPYIKLKLLMPEPAADHGEDPAARIEEVQFFNHLLFSNRMNKDWRTISVFSDFDEDMGPPLSPLEEQFDEQDDDDYESSISAPPDRA